MKSILAFVFALGIFHSCAQEKQTVTEIGADSMKTMITGEHAVILDVRTPEEYAQGHIPGAINIDYQNEKFSAGLDTLNRDLEYHVYCRSGRRSGESVEIMKQKGFTKIYHLQGGILEWEEKGYPVKKEE